MNLHPILRNDPEKAQRLWNDGFVAGHKAGYLRGYAHARYEKRHDATPLDRHGHPVAQERIAHMNYHRGYVTAYTVGYETGHKVGSA